MILICIDGESIQRSMVIHFLRKAIFVVTLSMVSSLTWLGTISRWLSLHLTTMDITTIIMDMAPMTQTITATDTGLLPTTIMAMQRNLMANIDYNRCLFKKL